MASPPAPLAPAPPTAGRPGTRLHVVKWSPKIHSKWPLQPAESKSLSVRFIISICTLVQGEIWLSRAMFDAELAAGAIEGMAPESSGGSRFVFGKISELNAVSG